MSDKAQADGSKRRSDDDASARMQELREKNSGELRPHRNREGAVTRRTYLPDRMEYLRLPLLKNSVWLQVLSSDARYFRATGQVKKLWRGESAMLARTETLDENARFLLVPSLKYFGRSTPDIITVDVREHDAAWH